jgi:hypothetical protein
MYHCIGVLKKNLAEAPHSPLSGGKSLEVTQPVNGKENEAQSPSHCWTTFPIIYA